MRTTRALGTAWALVASACAPSRGPAPAAVSVPVQPAPAPVVPDAGAGRPLAVAVAPPPLPPFEVAAPPALRPLDAKHPIENGAWLVGHDDAKILLDVDDAWVVVDRATGCATESYPHAPALRRLDELARDDVPPSPDLAAGIRETVGLGLRFGVTSVLRGTIVWSRDGRHVFVNAARGLHHSSDGGKTFTRDDPSADRLAVSSDGEHLVYEQSGRYVTRPVDGSRPPVQLTSGQTMMLGTSNDGRFLFWRSARDVCLDVFLPAKPTRESATCQTLPPQTSSFGVWPSNYWVDVSPSRTWGILKWEELRPNLAGVPRLTYVVALVDLRTNTIEKTVTDVLGEVDDDGNMVLHAMNEGGGDHTYFQPRKGARKHLASRTLMTWDRKNKVAILFGAYGKSTLGAKKCELVRLVKTP